MPDYKLIFETSCGASGDMLLAALLDLEPLGPEFIRRFESIGLGVKIECLDVEKNHLRGKQVTVRTSGDSPLRHYDDIRRFIEKSPFSSRVQGDALSVFERIFRAEAAVHGESLHDVHLHELGADDSLVDILGFCYLWERIEFPPLCFTTLVTGSGHIDTRHGRLPVPPPAVLRLIEGCRCRPGEIETELLTPTGAALLTTLGRQLPPDEAFVPEQTGIGCGQRAFPSIPNIVRAIKAASAQASATPPVWVLEFFVDDMTGEMVGHLGEALLAAGAIDFFASPGLMKKGRLGHHITVLCEEAAYPQVSQSIFDESTTIGLRQQRQERLVLEREEREVVIDSVPLRFKVARLSGRECNRKPEFEDVKSLARAKGISLKQAYWLAIRTIHEDHGPE